MSQASPDDLMVLLDLERAAFLAELERIPEGRRSQRPAPERWSAVEIAEHVARIDTGVSKLIAMKSAEPGQTTPQQLADAALTPEKVARVRSRDQRIEAPERVRPTGTLSPDEAVAHLAGARAALRAAYLGADPSLLESAVYPHPIIGPLTLRAWVELAAHHDARHAQQLAELAGELRNQGVA